MNTLPYKDKITIAEVLRNIKDNNGELLSFTLKKNWASTNYASLNDAIDDTVDGAEHFYNIVYLADHLELQDIIFTVIVHDVGEFLEQYDN